MIVLGIDAACAACSAALWRDGHIVARRLTAQSRGQAEILVPLIQQVLAEAGLGWAQLSRLAVTIGPGSFTGVRVALATARGLALATGLPLVGLSTFEVIAHGLPEGEGAGRELLVAVDSRRAELFFQRFSAELAPLGEPWQAEPATLVLDRPLLVAGDGAPRVRAALGDQPRLAWAEGPGLPDAAVVAALGASRSPGPPPRPLYLRAPDVTLPAPESIL